MKRVGLVVGLAAGLAALAAALAPALTPADTVDAAVSRQVEALTGRALVIGGKARLSLVPVPTVKVREVSIPAGPGQPPLLAADEVRGTLRLLPLLMGRLEVANLTIVHPTLAVTREQAPLWLASWRGPAPAPTPDHEVARLPVDTVRLIDGAVLYTDSAGAPARFEVQDAALSWPSPDAGLSASGAVVWRGQPLDVSVQAADPRALLGGGTSEVRGRLTGDLLHVQLGGTLDGRAGRLDGTLSAGAPALRDVLAWLGHNPGEGEGLGPVLVQSPVRLAGGVLSLPEVQVELDRNSAAGALDVTLDPAHPRITGTLAADTVDATAYADALRLTDGPYRRWREDAIDLGLLGGFDLDLRVSAGATTIGRTRLDHVAADAVVRNGALEVSIGEAEAYGGTLKGRLSLGPLPPGQPGVKADASLDAAGLEAGTALDDAFGFHRLDGTAGGTLEVAATGRSVRELARTLAGTAELAVREGGLNGLDVPEVLRRIRQRPLSAGFETHSGRTGFTSLSGSFTINHGLAATRDVALRADGLTIGLDGTADVGARQLDLVGHTTLAAGADDAGGFALPFRIGGSWSWPEVEPDAEALIRQSDAAAPLLSSATKTITTEAVPAVPPATVVPAVAP